MSDLFRKAYRALTDEDKAAMAGVKDAATAYHEALERFLPPSREKSLAITKIEESVMWAIKGVTG